MMSNLSRFQAAAASKDEELAQQLGCAILADSEKTLTTFKELDAAGCPIKGDITTLRRTIDNTRNQVRQGLARECGMAPQYSNFAGSWRSQGTCPATGLAAHRWIVSLSQNGDQVSGTIAFHRCPGGGRAQYAVSGTAGSGETVRLSGRLQSSRGPLAETVRQSLNFTVTRNAPPAPNLAP
jgi:hypothetical protein